jgi:hypothetical protein
MSEGELYIVVTNWRRFQYYRNRNPPWIKNLTQLLHDDNYLSLPPGTRALLHGLWLEYASSNARVRLDTRSLSARLRLRVTKQQLDWLERKGFIEYAQTPRRQDVVTSRAREEEETENVDLKLLDERGLKTSRGRSDEERDETPFDFDKILRDMP